jgi:hypothetical protein
LPPEAETEPHPDDLHEEPRDEFREPAPERERDVEPPPRQERSEIPREQPPRPATIQDAIDEVSVIVDTLRRTLDEMEEVLESLEHLERQGSADEREIESLRRALRQLQRPQEREREHHRGRS